MNQGFSYYFCLMIEGSGAGYGSIPLTSGSGSGRPKYMWIRKLGQLPLISDPRDPYVFGHF